MNFDVFSWTIHQVMSDVHMVMTHLTNCFAKKHAPELDGSSPNVKGLFFVKYTLKYKKLHMMPFFQANKITKAKMTE